jgi:hypothetical protein
MASKISSIGLRDSEMGATLLRKSRLISNEIYLQIGKPEDLEVDEGNILEDKSEMHTPLVVPHNDASLYNTQFL